LGQVDLGEGVVSGLLGDLDAGDGAAYLRNLPELSATSWMWP
jgi:hypothetical protein